MGHLAGLCSVYLYIVQVGIVFCIHLYTTACESALSIVIYNRRYGITSRAVDYSHFTAEVLRCTVQLYRVLFFVILTD